MIRAFVCKLQREEESGDGDEERGRGYRLKIDDMFEGEWRRYNSVRKSSRPTLKSIHSSLRENLRQYRSQTPAEASHNRTFSCECWD